MIKFPQVLDAIKSGSRYVIDNPGKCAVGLSQGIVAVALAYVAFSTGRDLVDLPFSCSIACASDKCLEYGTKLLSTFGLMIASVVIARHNFFCQQDKQLENPVTTPQGKELAS